MTERNYKIDIYVHEDGGVEAQQGQKQDRTSTEKNTGLYVAYKIAQPILNGAKQMVKNEVDIMYSNTELSQRVGLGLQAIDEAQNLVGKVASGMTMAKALGFSMSSAGIVGITTTVLNAMVNVAVKSQQLYLKSIVENEAHNITIGRMGTQYNNSRR